MAKYPVLMALLLWLVGASQWVVAENLSPKQWLQRMVQASEAMSYRGLSAHLSGGQLSSLSIYHAPFEGESWSRIVQLSGEPAEIIRKGSQVVCLHQRTARRLSPAGSLFGPRKGVEHYSRFYQLKLSSGGRIAGRQAQRIDVIPKDDNRYGYQLWLDSRTGLLLKSQTMGEQQQPLEVFEFVSLDLDTPLTKADFEPSPGLKPGDAPLNSATKAQLQSNRDPAKNWGVGWLPEGFQQVKDYMQMQGEGQFSARVYSDGLAAFTVFFDANNAKQTVQFRGATVAVRHSANGASVTVVGEVPLKTAQRVADNVNTLALKP